MQTINEIKQTNHSNASNMLTLTAAHYF